MKDKEIKLDSYCIQKGRDTGFGIGIWGQSDATHFPLVYLRKPKWMHEDDFQMILDGIILDLPKNTVLNKNTGDR